MYFNKHTSKGYINPPFNCWKLRISKREYFLWRKWKCRNGSDADFPHRPASIFPHRPASMSPWSTSTLVSKQCNRYYKKIIMMSQIQFCSQKFIRPTKAKRQDHPWSRRYSQLRPCWLWTATSSWLTRTTATSTSSSASRSGNAWKALHVQPSWIKMTIDDAF